MRPAITVLATTYFPPGGAGQLRREAFRDTLVSWGEHLRYAGELALHVADDDQPPGAGEELAYGIAPAAFDGRLSNSHQARRGVGASLNAGFRQAFERSPLVLYAVDDWSLAAPFDVTLWADLLMEHEDIGCVRLGPPHPNIRGAVEMFSVETEPPANPERGGWFLRLEPYAFAFGHRPALYHRRFIDAFGDFPEDTNALECERIYAEAYGFARRHGNGPMVVLALPHPWRHIASVELADLQPKGG